MNLRLLVFQNIAIDDNKKKNTQYTKQMGKIKNIYKTNK